MHWMNQAAQRNLVERGFVWNASSVGGAYGANQGSVQNFYGIRDISSMWAWLEGPFRDTFLTNTSDLLGANTLIGDIRIRQLRVRADARCDNPLALAPTCDLCSIKNSAGYTCRPNYSSESRSTVKYNSFDVAIALDTKKSSFEWSSALLLAERCVCELFMPLYARELCVKFLYMWELCEVSIRVGVVPSLYTRGSFSCPFTRENCVKSLHVW